MTEGLTTAAVLARLAAIRTPDGDSLDRSDRLQPAVIADGRIALSIEIVPSEAAAWEPVRKAAADALTGLAGVRAATVVMTANRVASGHAASTAAGARSSAAAGPAGNVTIARDAGPPSSLGATRPVRFPSLARVRHVVAVASGKGGVGKSTTAVNIALALAMLPGPAGRLKVGLLDADIYGPSVPKLLALRGQPRIISGRLLEPMPAAGLAVMSIGLLVDPDKAMIWRGPMVASAITQMLRDVAWGSLDVLVVDMPPGTGDAQLSLSQQAPLDGAVIVSTPQDLALVDARRGVAMFHDVGVPILGLVENMSWFSCDDCGKRHHPFGHGGARAEAQRLGVPFLGEVPLDPAIRERSDAGLPIVLAEPSGLAAAAYREIAAGICERLRSPPRSQV